jgi:putative tricarboxylic transport membrane protein
LTRASWGTSFGEGEGRREKGEVRRKTEGLGDNASRVVAIVVACVVVACGDRTGGGSELACRSIEYIVGWGAGGGSDNFARAISPGVGEALGIPVKVINIPGGNAIPAMQQVLARPADGCTIFGISTDVVTNEAVGLTELSHEDLTPLIRAHVDVAMLLVDEEDRFDSWQDVLSYAKENPGDLLVGATGAAGYDEIALGILLESAGIAYRYIPYESGPSMHADLLGGRLDIAYEEISVIFSMIDAGQVKPVMVIAEQRVGRFPDVVSAGELGYEVPPLQWRGVAAHGATPREVAETLERALLEAVTSGSYREFEERRMLDLFPGVLGSADFLPILERDMAIFRDVVKQR